MSTKTTFKRIALVAVAALGLGVLSVAPSSAAVSSLTITVTNGTANTGSNYDSTTGAAVQVRGLIESTADSYTVAIVTKSVPTGSTAQTPRLRYLDSVTPFTGNFTTVQKGGTQMTKLDSVTPANVSANAVIATTSAAGYVGANFRVELDSSTARTAGTYTYTVFVKTFTGGAEATSYTADASIVVSKTADQSATANAANSTAVLYAGSSFVANNTVDSAVATVSTASATAVGTIRIALKNTAGGYAQESITATITGAGTIGNASIGGAAGTGVSGKSVVVTMTSANYVDLNVYADGSAGTSTINLSSTSVTFAPKSINFYAKSPKTITASAYNPVLAVGANGSAIAATAVDANGVAWTGQLYVVASSAADALVGGSATVPVACSYSSTYATHFCPVTTITTGTASFKVVDETRDTDADDTTYAAADSAATSNAVSLTVSNSAATTVKLAFDKTTYAPFEKARITVTVLGADGMPKQGATYGNLFATGGITANQAFGSASDTLTAVSVTTDSANGTDATAGAKTYIVYMPAQGDVTISATGGLSLAPAGQVKVTATASVVNDSVNAATDAANEATDAANAATDAALAAADAADAATAAAQDASDAVAALSASVSKMIASLKAQITSLTNLVIKIQKKVRA
jgi:hypothetical protein